VIIKLGLIVQPISQVFIVYVNKF